VTKKHFINSPRKLPLLSSPEPLTPPPYQFLSQDTSPLQLCPCYEAYGCLCCWARAPKMSLSSLYPQNLAQILHTDSGQGEAIKSNTTGKPCQDLLLKMSLLKGRHAWGKEKPVSHSEADCSRATPSHPPSPGPGVAAATSLNGILRGSLSGLQSLALPPNQPAPSQDKHSLNQMPLLPPILLLVRLSGFEASVFKNKGK
jgi:hypothetical protein